VSFSSDGKLLAAGSGRTFKLWEVETGRQVCTISDNTGSVGNVAFSPDGKFIASSSNAYRNYTIKLWKLQVHENQAPQANFTFSPMEPSVSLDATFDASSSSDLDGSITSYEWDFGDGTTGSGKLVAHAYDRKGTVTITLTVTDDDGASASTSQSIEVVNRSPQADFSFTPSDPCILDEVHFTDRSTDPDGDIVSWHWDFGDGATSDERNPTHRYEREGTFTVELVVTDNDGLTDETSQTIVVEHKDLIQTDFTFHVVDEVLHKIYLDASSSIDTMGEIVRYEWDWDGDGVYDTAVQAPEMIHRFEEDGPYQVILTIVDDQGNRATCTREVSL